MRVSLNSVTRNITNYIFPLIPISFLPQLNLVVPIHIYTIVIPHTYIHNGNSCIFRKNRALAPHERSAVPLGTDHCPVG